MDPTWIGQGIITFLFDLLGTAVIGDVHLELTFAAPAPAYAPLTHWLSSYLTVDVPEPTVAWIGSGPGSRFTVINGNAIWNSYPIFFGLRG